MQRRTIMQTIRIDGNKKLARFDRLVPGTDVVIGQQAHLLAYINEDKELLTHTSPVQHIIENPDGSMCIETVNSIYMGKRSL